MANRSASGRAEQPCLSLCADAAPCIQALAGQRLQVDSPSTTNAALFLALGACSKWSLVEKASLPWLAPRLPAKQRRSPPRSACSVPLPRRPRPARYRPTAPREPWRPERAVGAGAHSTSAAAPTVSHFLGSASGSISSPGPSSPAGCAEISWQEGSAAVGAPTAVASATAIPHPSAAQPGHVGFASVSMTAVDAGGSPAQGAHPRRLVKRAKSSNTVPQYCSREGAL